MQTIQALRETLKPVLGVLLDKESKDVQTVSPRIQEEFYSIEEESYKDEAHLRKTKRAWLEPADPFQISISRPKVVHWPVMEYFVDGSIRSLYIGSIQTHRYVFPMHISQIGVSVLYRSKNELKCYRPPSLKFVIVLPISYLGDTTRSKINKIKLKIPQEISEKVQLT